MSSVIVCRILASNYQANNHYNRAGAKCPIFLVMLVFTFLDINRYIISILNRSQYVADNKQHKLNIIYMNYEVEKIENVR